MTLEELKAAPKVIGIKQTLKAAERGTVSCICIAADADRRVVEPLRILAREKGVPLYEAAGMSELGKAAGIEVGAAAIGVLR